MLPALMLLQGVLHLVHTPSLLVAVAELLISFDSGRFKPLN